MREGSMIKMRSESLLIGKERQHFFKVFFPHMVAPNFHLKATKVNCGPEV